MFDKTISYSVEYKLPLSATGQSTLEKNSSTVTL